MTGIQWTDEVWNATTGCDKVSPGCGLPRFDGDLSGGCYAMAMAKRLKAMGQAKYQRDGDPRTSGPGFGVTIHPDVLEQPLRWRRPRRIFVNSMSDLFHQDVPDEFISQVFDVMEQATHHVFQVLTKRHARMRSFMRARHQTWVDYAAKFDDCPTEAMRNSPAAQWARKRATTPPPHIWLGVSAEDQKWADTRIPALLETPAAVRFVSAEPLLGPISFRWAKWHEWRDSDHLDGLRQLDWVIVGGESGPGARPMEIEWARSLVRECRDAGVAPFVKQLGAIRGRELGIDSHGANWDGWPADLRVREFPGAPVAASA